MNILLQWRAGWRRVRQAGLWVTAVGLATMQAGWAANLAIVLSDDSAPYQEVFDAIRARADERDISVSRLYARDASEAGLSARLVVAVGVRAVESVARMAGRTPVLVVLVPRDWYQKTGRPRLLAHARRPVSALYRDQPLVRQVMLIRLAFPQARRVGVLLSAAEAEAHDDIGSALRVQGLSPVSEVLEAGQKLTVAGKIVFDGRSDAGRARRGSF